MALESLQTATEEESEIQSILCDVEPGEVPLETLWHAVPCFPTRSELWLRLLEAYGL